MLFKALIICAVAAAALAIEYPPGIDPLLCPNYPNCDMELLARHNPLRIPIHLWELPYARMAPYPAPVPIPTKFGAIEYPEGVDPLLCPNYPYCV